jgi:hypothetical protein
LVDCRPAGCKDLVWSCSTSPTLGWRHAHLYIVCSLRRELKSSTCWASLEPNGQFLSISRRMQGRDWHQVRVESKHAVRALENAAHGATPYSRAIKRHSRHPLDPCLPEESNLPQTVILFWTNVHTIHLCDVRCQEMMSGFPFFVVISTCFIAITSFLRSDE